MNTDAVLKGNVLHDIAFMGLRTALGFAGLTAYKLKREIQLQKIT